MTSTRSTFAADVRAARQAAGHSLSAVAAASGVSVSFLCDLEHSRREPSLETAVRLAKALGVPAAWLVERLLQERLDGAGVALRVVVRDAVDEAAAHELDCRTLGGE
jgi:transcriptional regulator with XRE-family HTH domain